MRIAIVIYSMQAGGAERVTANLAHSWAERGWEVHLITLTSAADDFYEVHPDVRRHGLDLGGLSTNPVQAVWSNTRRAVALHMYLRRVKPDVVLGTMTHSAVLGVLAARTLGCRVVVAEHAFPPQFPVGTIWETLRGVTYPFAHRVVMLTSEGLDWLHHHIPRARGVVIPNAVRFPLPAAEPRLAPETLVAPERKVLLAIGRMDEVRQKQFDWLLDAFAMVAARHPRWDLIVLGDGPDRPALRSQVERLQLRDRARLPGRVGNVGEWYTRADLYVMSSRWEGFPMTLAEALAHGCAAVSYDCDTGPRDLIRDGVDGLLVRPVGDIRALASALDGLMGDEATRRRMAARAVEIRDRYSAEAILSRWDRVFDASPRPHEA